MTLSLFLMVPMMGMLAFAVDLGYLHVARTELQRTADSAAIAAAWELIDQNAPVSPASRSTLEANARATASEFAALNRVLQDNPVLSSDDIAVGYLSDPSNPSSAFDTTGIMSPNAVRVRVRRTSGQNGEIPLFFARVLGLNSVAMEAEATAAVRTNIGGFRTPSDGSNLGILPFALDEFTWLSLLGGVGSDNWKVDESTGKVVAGSDGILEANLYPQGTGAPGNRGTVDIGSSNNSTADIARQILRGITPEDMEHHNGELVFNETGELFLNGDTGISAGIKDELATIKGEPKVIPIFREVTGPGNNATYTIVAFAGVRVMDVNLTGSMSNKRVIFQPTVTVVPRGAVPYSSGYGDGGVGGEAVQSYFVTSPAWLVR